MINVMLLYVLFFFFFKQKTAYEMRISDWSSDVCSSDLAAGTSERTLARRLQSVLGKTPLSYFQDLRVEHAVHLLRTGNASVDQVAAQVGYSDGVTLRALLRRKLGRGVRELRRGG